MSSRGRLRVVAATTCLLLLVVKYDVLCWGFRRPPPPPRRPVATARRRILPSQTTMRGGADDGGELGLPDTLDDKKQEEEEDSKVVVEASPAVEEEEQEADGEVIAGNDGDDLKEFLDAVQEELQGEKEGEDDDGDEEFLDAVQEEEKSRTEIPKVAVMDATMDTPVDWDYDEADDDDDDDDNVHLGVDVVQANMMDEAEVEELLDSIEQAEAKANEEDEQMEQEEDNDDEELQELLKTIEESVQEEILNDIDDDGEQVAGEMSDDQEEEEEYDGQGALEFLTAHTKRTMAAARKRYWPIVRPYRNKMIIAATFLLFRREILQLLVKILFVEETASIKDPRTGEVTSRQTRSFHGGGLILKLALLYMVIQYMRQKQNNDGGTSPTLIPFLLSQLTGMNPVVWLALRRFWEPSNPAYVPPVEQHYSFEVLNYRYRKDAMALEKVQEAPSPLKWNLTVLPQPKLTNNTTSDSNATTNSTTTSNSHNNTLGNILSWQLSLPTRTSQSDQLETDDNVIVLDMTGLDVSLSQLDVIRDKVSFLLSEHRRRAMTRWNSWSKQHDDGLRAITMMNNSTTAQGGDSRDGACNQTTGVARQSVLPLEVVVVLESQGGSAAEYALAAAQLLRLRREPGIKLTICVDKVAASGT